MFPLRSLKGAIFKEDFEHSIVGHDFFTHSKGVSRQASWMIYNKLTPQQDGHPSYLSKKSREPL
jgi:hypothetical protein